MDLINFYICFILITLALLNAATVASAMLSADRGEAARRAGIFVLAMVSLVKVYYWLPEQGTFGREGCYGTMFWYSGAAFLLIYQAISIAASRHPPSSESPAGEQIDPTDEQPPEPFA